MSDFLQGIMSTSCDPTKLLHQYNAKRIVIGRTPGKEGHKLWLSTEERARHMHVLGPTGVGKSKFLQWMIQQDITAKHGMLVLDPTGKLYNDLIAWITYKDLWRQRDIVLLDPNALGHSFSYNPLSFAAPEGESNAFAAQSFVRAVAQVFRTGGSSASMSDTPRLKSVLRNVVRALSDADLTLLEKDTLLTQREKNEVQQYILSQIKSEEVRRDVETNLKLTKREFETVVESTRNRLGDFVSSERMQRIIGQSGKSIDFRDLMDRQAIVLVDLSTGGGRFPAEDGRLLGTLIINELLVHAQQRPTDNPPPFFLYIDECHRYLTDDIATILKETRKYGMYCTLAHQNLEDLKQAGMGIYHAVMTNAKTKIVFGGLDFDEAEVMVKNIFDKEILEHRDDPIEVLNKPTVVGYKKTLLKSRADVDTHASAEGINQSTSSGASAFESTAMPEVGFFDVATPTSVNVAGSGGMSSNASGESSVKSKGYSHMEGESETLEPILEERPTAVRGEAGVIFEMVVKLRSVPIQHAVIRPPYDEMKTHFLYVPTVEDVLTTARRIEEVKSEQILQLSEYYTPNEVIEQQIRNRRSELEKRSGLTIDLDTGEYVRVRNDEDTPDYPF